LIKNSKPFGKNVRKPQGGFFDSHCMYVCICMFYSGDHLVWLIGCLSEGGHAVLIVQHFSGRLIQASYIYCQKTCSLN